MKAARIKSYDDAPAIEEVETPDPGPDEVLVRVAAASLNPLDVKLQKGYLDAVFPVEFPYTIGTDLAGTIERLGLNVTGWSAMSDMLTSNPKLGGVFSVQDSIALGAANALVSRKRLDVKQVSIDASASAIQVMQKRKGIDADIAQHFLSAGYLSVTTLARALNGQTVPRKVDTGITVVTRANAAAYLKRAKAESQ